MSGVSARKLLIVGPALDGSSYSRVVQSVFSALAPLLRAEQPTWEIEQFAINVRESCTSLDWTCLPNRQLGDRYGMAQLPALISERKPDVIWVFNCFTVLPRYGACFAALPYRPKLIAYCPLLGTPLALGTINALAGFDALITVSAGVQALFERVLRQAQQAGTLACMPQLGAIAHGFDQTRFFPLAQAARADSRCPWQHRRALKAQVLGGFADSDDGFVVLNGNRNTPRKHIETTLEGFAQFARGKPPGVQLYLHMAESLSSDTLAARAAALGIAERVRIAGAPGCHPMLSDSELNALYNACDVGINTASAEGFGMVSLEHAATGAPQIVPGHGVCGELWQGYADVLPADELVCGRAADVIEHRPVRAQALSEALERLYCDPSHYVARAVQALQLSQSPRFRWSEIARQWQALIAGLCP